MKPVKNIITIELLKKMASRSHFRYGEKLYENGDVTLLDGNVFNIHAEVKHNDKNGQLVDLMSTSKGFRYKCTCTARKDYFCEHCVAVGLKAIEV
jgi:uncharacterized Zn finger protein